MIIQTTDNGRNGRWPTFSEARKALPQGPRGKWIFSPRADAEKAYLPDAGFCLRLSICLSPSFGFGSCGQVSYWRGDFAFGVSILDTLCGPDFRKYIFGPVLSTCREGTPVTCFLVFRPCSLGSGFPGLGLVFLACVTHPIFGPGSASLGVVSCL